MATGKNVEPAGVFVKNHVGAVKAMDDHGGSIRRVHGYAAYFAYMREGENVDNGGWIEPDLAEIREVANECRVLKTAVRDGAKGTLAGSDGLDHFGVVENGDRGL